MSPTRREVLHLMAGGAVAAIAPVATRQEPTPERIDVLPAPLQLMGTLFLYGGTMEIDSVPSVRFYTDRGRLWLQQITFVGDVSHGSVPLDCDHMSARELVQVLSAG